jgi:hypothetical protein
MLALIKTEMMLVNHPCTIREKDGDLLDASPANQEAVKSFTYRLEGANNLRQAFQMNMHLFSSALKP